MQGAESAHSPERQQSRAIKALARAIEYLEETKPLRPEITPRIAAVNEAVTLLKACHRDVFFSCSTERQRKATTLWTDTLSVGHDYHAQWTNA